MTSQSLVPAERHQPPATFEAAVTRLRRAEAFLRRPVANQRSTADYANAGTAADHACKRLGLLAQERQDAVCVLILGEFNSGKSTLLNAIVGRKVAEMDVFELTSAVCRVVCSAAGPDTVRLRSTGATREVALAEFLRLCRERALGDCRQADAYVRSDCRLVLVDTPGIGASDRNEMTAMDAVTTCDVVLYCVDATCLGSPRDRALLDRLISLGLPLRCAVTKCDTRDDIEVAEAAEYVAEDLGVPAGHVFLVRAKQASEGRIDAGVDALRRHLQQAVEAGRAELRRAALMGQAEEVAAQFRHAVGQVRQSVDQFLHEVEEFHLAMLMQAEVVTDSMCRAASTELWEQLRLDLERELMRVTGISPAVLLPKLVESLKADPRFMSALESQVTARHGSEWMEGMRQNMERLTAGLGQALDAANKDAEMMYREIMQREQMKADATKSAIAAVALAVGSTVFMGPLGLLTAVPLVVDSWWLRHQAGNASKQELEDQLHLAFDRWRDDVIERFVADLRLGLLPENRKVADRAADDYARRISDWPCTREELALLRDECDQLVADLSAFRPG